MGHAKLVISGYYGFGNAGDEALLAGLLAGLRQLAPHVEPVVLSGDPKATAALHAVAAVDRRSPVAVWRTLGGAAGLLSGGGSLLQDATSRRSVYYYLGIMMMAGWRGLPYCVYGQGIGPLTSPTGKVLARWVLQRSRGIWVRDAGSHSKVLALGVRVGSPGSTGPTRPLAVTCDPAFLLPPVSVEEGERPAGAADLNPVWAVAMRPWGDTARWLEPLVEGLARAAIVSKATVVLVPMHASMDAPLAADMARALQESRVAVEVVRPGSYRHVQRVLAGADLVIAMRLHALILAAASAVAGVAISYDPKVTALAGELPLPWVPVQSLAAGEGASLVAGLLSRAWAARQELAARLRQQAGPRRERALAGLQSALVALGLLPASPQHVTQFSKEE